MARKKKAQTSPTPVPVGPEDIKHIRQLWLDGLSVAELSEKFEQSREFLWSVLEGERGEPSPRVLECSFCGKTQFEARMLIAGPRALICDQCTGLAVDIIKTQDPDWVHIVFGPAPTAPQS